MENHDEDQEEGMHHFVVECNVCKQRYDDWDGSTPCCGSIAYIVNEDGSVSDNISLFASIGGGPVKPVTLDIGKDKEFGLIQVVEDRTGESDEEKIKKALYQAKKTGILMFDDSKKYFTPKLEDLFVGYQCEVFKQSTTHMVKDVRWHPITVHSTWEDPGKHIAFNQARKMINAGTLRTPLLTMESIYAEGYERTKHSMKAFNHIPEPAGMMDGFEYDYEIFFMEQYQSLHITRTTKGGWGGQHTVEKIYQGPCQSINEFRKIEQWLKMKIAY